MVTLKVELDVQAERILHQLQMHNEEVEAQVNAGVKDAFEALNKDGQLRSAVEAATKTAVIRMIERSVESWSFSYKLENLIKEKIDAKVHEYADRLAENVTKSLQSNA